MNSSIKLGNAGLQTQTPHTTAAGGRRPGLGLAAELARSEERLRRFVADLDAYDALYVVDARGRVVAWNAAAEMLLGYSAEEICGQHHGALYPLEAALTDRPTAVLARAARVGLQRERGWRRRRDGTRCEVEATITSLGLPGGEPAGFVVTMRRAGVLAPFVPLDERAEEPDGTRAATTFLVYGLDERAA